MRNQAKRLIYLTIAIACLLVGAITLPMPIPLGIPLLAIGIALMILISKTVRNWMRNIRIRYPSFDEKLRTAENYLPRPLRRALRVSAPRSKPPKNTSDKPA